MGEERNMLSNNERIFAKEIASNSDTRGRKKFISRQLEALESNATNKARLCEKDDVPPEECKSPTAPLEE